MHSNSLESSANAFSSCHLNSEQILLCVVLLLLVFGGCFFRRFDTEVWQKLNRFIAALRPKILTVAYGECNGVHSERDRDPDDKEREGETKMEWQRPSEMERLAGNESICREKREFHHML